MRMRNPPGYGDVYPCGNPGWDDFTSQRTELLPEDRMGKELLDEWLPRFRAAVESGLPEDLLAGRLVNLGLERLGFPTDQWGLKREDGIEFLLVLLIARIVRREGADINMLAEALCDPESD